MRARAARSALLRRRGAGFPPQVCVYVCVCACVCVKEFCCFFDSRRIQTLQIWSCTRFEAVVLFLCAWAVAADFDVGAYGCCVTLLEFSTSRAVLSVAWILNFGWQQTRRMRPRCSRSKERIVGVCYCCLASRPHGSISSSLC